MELNNLEGRSRGSSFRRRALTLVGASALTLSGVGAAVFGASEAFAQTAIQSNPYSIGTVAAGGLTFSASNTAEGAQGVNYTFGFTVPSGDSGTSIALNDLPGSTTATSAVVTDSNSSGSTTTTGVYANTATASGSNGSVTGITVNAGDSLTIVVDGFTNTNALTANPYSISAAVGSTVVATTSFNLTSAASGPTVSVSPTTPSYAGSTTTFNGFTGISGNIVDVAVSGGITFSAAMLASNYTVTYTTSGSTTQNSATVQSATADTTISTGGSYVQLNLGVILASGDTVNVVAAGTDNSSSSTSGPYSGTVESGSVGAAPSTPSGSPTFLIGYSMSAVSLSVSPTTSGASNATYGVSFVVPSTAGSNPTLTTSFKDANGGSVGLNSGGTLLGTGYAIFDSTNPSVNTSSSSGAPAAGIALDNVAAGDSVTVDYYGITNSTSASVTGTVSLGSDNIPAKTNTVSYTSPSSTSSALNVAVSNNAPSATATYTISGLEVGGTGVTSSGKTIQLDFTTGTSAQTNLVLPTGSVNYTLTDLTNSSSSGATLTSGGGNNGPVTLTTTNAMTAGDALQITITGVQNPSVAANNEYVTTDTASSLPLTTGVVAPSTAPNAASTMATGSLVQNGGTIYVVAGGVAFGIPTYADFVVISNGLGNPAVVQVTTGPSTVGTLASGTLVQVVGSPEIMVVGSNNTAYGFSTPSQFSSDGYSSARVIQIPSLGNLTVGSAVAPSAASTMASGSLVQNGGTIYVIAGGVAFGIPTYSDFTTISAELGNPTVVQISSAPSTTGTMASGTLVQVVGSPQINVVTTTGTQVGFSTASQFLGDGYSPSKVVMIP